MSIFKSILYFVFSFLIFSGFRFRKNTNKNEPLNVALSVSTKGIAAVMIVIGHCLVYLGSNNVNIDFINVGWYCVAMFFFWSGYGVTHGAETKKNYISSFWKTRLIKVLIPFIIAHIFYLIVKLMFGETFAASDVIYGLLGQLNIVENSWYSIAVLVLYLAFWVTFSKVGSKKYKFIVLFIFVMVITFAEAMIFGISKNWWYISNLAFALGSFIRLYDRNLKYWKQYILISCIGYILAMASYPGFNYLFGYYSFPVYVISNNLMSTFVVLLIITVLGKFGNPNKIMTFLGDISYEIYLMYGLVIYILGKIGSEINIFILYLLVLIFTIPLAWLVHKLNKSIIKKLLTVRIKQAG